MEFANRQRSADLKAKIRLLAKQKGALILAHNYQRPEIQDVADFVGDSLALSRAAAKARARMIVFCGVHFMAETAAILVPDCPVIAPEPEAACSLADMVDVQGLLTLKAGYPNAVVVSYVNSSAAVKAVSDICCTSANAPEVLASIPEDTKIIFTPDRNLGAWAARRASREVIVWPGFCPTHEAITVDDLRAARAAHPQAKVVVHPECSPEVTEEADAVESTEGMIRFCRTDEAKEYLVGTEVGMLYRLQRQLPNKRFYPVSDLAVCPFMKLTTLEKVLEALVDESPVVTIDPETRAKALRAVERMIEVGK
ncbi:MAG: quinolinate synthase NadA [Thermoleophilia bacterium]|nr:quinolinate synthase NadA [Thermoleophilia bacterium]